MGRDPFVLLTLGILWGKALGEKAIKTLEKWFWDFRVSRHDDAILNT